MPSLRPFCALVVLAAACGEDPKVVRARAEVRAVDQVAQEVRALPKAVATGKWSEATLMQRFVDAGLAPHPDDSIPRHPKLGGTPLTLRLGRAHLLAWVYPDSAARRRAGAKIDTTAAYAGDRANAWAEPPLFVFNNNLIAVIIGGSDRARERIRLSIEAGLPAPK